MSADSGSYRVTKKKLAVLISGNGSNLQAILDACKSRNLPALVVVVISNREDAYGLVRAEKANVPIRCMPYLKSVSREENDFHLAEVVLSYQPDWVILAGWMRILTDAFLKKFPSQVINLHPALPGTYPGVNAIDRAFKDYQAGLITKTGVMVHYVPDEGVDNGPLISKKNVNILQEDTLQTLEERIHQVEHELLVETIKTLCKS